MRSPLATSLCASLLFATAAPVAASQGSQSNQASAAEPKAAAPAEKKVCKRIATSGTRMAERVCLTPEQWKRVEQQQQQ